MQRVRGTEGSTDVRPEPNQLTPEGCKGCVGGMQRMQRMQRRGSFHQRDAEDGQRDAEDA